MRGAASSMPSSRCCCCGLRNCRMVCRYMLRWEGAMNRILKKTFKILGLTLAIVLLTLMGLRIYNIQQSPPLGPWHTYVPDELHAAKLDQISWQPYVEHEENLFSQVRQNVGAKLSDDDKVESNRYFDGARVNPGHFAHARSEERRVGKECVRTCSSGWTPYR